MFEVAERKYSVAEYLELEKVSDVRHEFYYGKLIPMAGESKNANKIANNCLILLTEKLSDRKLEIFTHDVRLNVKDGSIYRYPDLVVAPESDDEDSHAVTQPVLILEVLSNSTTGIDRGPKTKEYSSIPSLQHYMIASQDQMSVELYSRQDDGKNWVYTFFDDASEMIDLPAIGVRLVLGDLYKKIKFIE